MHERTEIREGGDLQEGIHVRGGGLVVGAHLKDGTDRDHVAKEKGGRRKMLIEEGISICMHNYLFIGCFAVRIPYRYVDVYTFT